MKVIDLLNKIANNEEVPKKIKYKNKIYFRTWSDYMGDEPIDEYYYDSEENSWNEELSLKLDDEIEIIEEKPKKIAKIPTLTYDGSSKAMKIHILKSHLEKTIEAVNYLLEKESDK